MSIPLIPYGRQTITSQDIDAVVSVLRSPMLTQGPTVPLFEHKLSSVLNSRFAVAVNSATSALHLGCLALDLSPGDSLWTSPITFVASANCGRFCGANIDFVDIDPSTGLLCLDSLKAKLREADANRSLPKIIVPVHLAGTSCAMDEIANLVRPYGISILEDASHAVGAFYEGQPVGCCEYSDASVFSFHPVKIITSGEGGALTTNERQIAERVQLLRSHGITKDESQFKFQSVGPWSYEQQELGFNYRLTDIHAALGLSQLSRLQSIVDERNRLWNRYYEQLSDLPVDLLFIPENCRSSLHLAIIRLHTDDVFRHRQIFESLRSLGIGVQLHYTPVHLHPYYRKLGFTHGDFPHAESYARSSISLPLFPGLSDSDQDKVVQELRNLL